MASITTLSRTRRTGSYARVIVLSRDILNIYLFVCSIIDNPIIVPGSLEGYIYSQVQYKGPLGSVKAFKEMEIKKETVKSTYLARY